MFEDHYGLTGRPFALTPDPEFWFDSATHRKAMAYLGYGLAQGEGFVVVTGEVGSGKTTLIRKVLATIDSDRLRPVSLVSTQLGPDDMLRAVAGDLGVTAPDKASLIAAVERALHAQAREGRRVLLVVDEAQNLSRGAIEELRMLSNFQLGPDPLVQVVLLGQPELRDRLAHDADLEPVRQRVVATHHLGPIEAEEVGPYLIHRLSAVGWSGRPDFTEDAVEAIDRWSGGLPRRMNSLASRILLAAALDDADLIGSDLVERVIADLESDAPESGTSLPAAAALAAVPALDDERVRRLEARVEAQDRALRHVLTLLVDWVEREPSATAEHLRGVA